MKIIDRYVASVVIAGTLTALLVVIGLDTFFSLIGQIDDVGEGGYTLLKMLATVALTIPHSMYELFPVAALLGSLTGMGLLATNSELIAMRASGMSIWRIVYSVMKAGIIMLCVVVILGEFVAPVAERYAQEIRTSAKDTQVTFMGGRGVWVRTDNLFINAKKVISGNSLGDVTVYEFDDDKRLMRATRAVHAHYRKGQWVMRNVSQTDFEGDTARVTQAERLARDSLLTPELLGIVVLEPENMSARFISVPFVFGGLRSVSAGQRVFVGILVGFGFYIVSQIAGQMGRVYELNPLLATLTPSLIFLLIGIRAVRRL